MDKYFLLAKKDEIASMVKKAPLMEIGEIWQTLPVKREVYKIVKLEVLSEALIFQTTLPFEFEKDFPVYIKINYQNLIFKLLPGEFKTSKNQLSCIFPKEAKAIDSRAINRTNLPHKTNLNLTLRTLSSESALDIKVSLENVSENGVGIKVTSLNEEYFHRNAVFKIIKVCGRIHLEDATLNVKHISRKESKGYLGIGMLASAPFSDQFFEILREEIKKERFAGS